MRISWRSGWGLWTFGLVAFAMLAIAQVGHQSLASASGEAAPAMAPGCAVQDENWQTADGGCKDLQTGFVFSDWTGDLPVGERRYTHSEALAYCDDLVEGGFSDWKLPKKKELEKEVNNDAAGHLNFETFLWEFMTDTVKGPWVYVCWLDGFGCFRHNADTGFARVTCCRGGNCGKGKGR